MDLFQAFAAIAAVNGVEKDTRDPFALMPKSIQRITLTHRKKKVDIPRTVLFTFSLALLKKLKPAKTAKESQGIK